MATLHHAVSDLLAAGQPMLAVCLGHQVVCDALGLDLGYKDIVFQGTQTRLPVLGRDQVVGFYNTFVARLPAGGAPAGVLARAIPTPGTSICWPARTTEECSSTPSRYSPSTGSTSSPPSYASCW
jgi:phenazine biosynthesis protein phzE